MKIKKTLIFLIIIFILTPATVSAATTDKNYLEGDVSIEKAEESAETHPAIICIFHEFEMYKTGGDSYSNDSSSTHTHRYLKYVRCTKCGKEETWGIERVENHVSRMTTAKCTGAQHIYEYGCVCGRYMGVSKEACPRPGNCPGLPLSITLDTK